MNTQVIKAATNAIIEKLNKSMNVIGPDEFGSKHVDGGLIFYTTNLATLNTRAFSHETGPIHNDIIQHMIAEEIITPCFEEISDNTLNIEFRLNDKHVTDPKVREFNSIR